MKKNSTKYLLGTALIGVWGLLGFRIYEKFNTSDSYQLLPQTTPYVESNTSSRTYQLSLDYNDPFLERKMKRAKPVSIRQSVDEMLHQRKVKKQKPQKRRVVFPQIIYKGNIKTKEGREVALMNVDGQFVQLAKSDTYQKLNVLQVYQDSIRIAYSGAEKTISRNR